MTGSPKEFARLMGENKVTIKKTWQPKDGEYEKAFSTSKTTQNKPSILAATGMAILVFVMCLITFILVGHGYGPWVGG